jgi:hypothetical protein
MSKVFKDAVAEAAALPEAVQDKIGRQLHDDVDKLRRLREDIGQGLRSLDSGAGKPLDVETVIRRARAAGA